MTSALHVLHQAIDDIAVKLVALRKDVENNRGVSETDVALIQQLLKQLDQRIDEQAALLKQVMNLLAAIAALIDTPTVQRLNRALIATLANVCDKPACAGDQ
jgi:flagellar biosynthesis chaperone FliJ